MKCQLRTEGRGHSPFAPYPQRSLWCAQTSLRSSKRNRKLLDSQATEENTSHSCTATLRMRFINCVIIYSSLGSWPLKCCVTFVTHWLPDQMIDQNKIYTTHCVCLNKETYNYELLNAKFMYIVWTRSELFCGSTSQVGPSRLHLFIYFKFYYTNYLQQFND